MINKHYLEALSRLSKAREVLKSANKKGAFYNDINYVKTASGAAYSCVLIAIDAYLRHQEKDFKKPLSIEDYRLRLAKQNIQLLAHLNYVYDMLYIAGNYHGTPSVKTIKEGFNEAYKIVDYIKN